ncbi:Bug family tripartite tricarboxylate transporter substrate binding protein [Variovorax sp. AFSI2.2]|uniref:Bug family tripartite tricarboxylate transporter substrate binding protein n=1 Tax=Variovorax sp. AFSI2.2 TaxID=3384160 RepID=UPI003EBECCD8
MQRRTIVGVAGALAASTIFSSLATEPGSAYPTKPLKVIVPFPAGGTTDTLMRIIGPRLSKSLGQAVVIENKSGASATVGADFVAKAASDGYTLLVGAAHHTIAQAVFAKLPYRFERDLAPIGLIALVPNVVVVNASVPAKSVQDLIALSKAEPDKYNYGSAGPGSAHHLIGEMFKLRTGAKLMHIPYRGSAPAVADLLGGQVSVMFDTVTSALPHIKAQKTRALAVTTAKRSSALPDVPTLAEAGVAEFDVGTWFGLLAPAGTPQAIVDKLNAEVVAIVNDPEVRKQMLNQGIEPLTSSPAELKARIAKELTEFGALAKQAKLSVE